jgi:GNAT superfamily N-acetyltransferase
MVGMTLEIRPLDPADESAMKRYHEIIWRAEKEDGRPWNAMWTFEELAGLFRVATDDQRNEGYAAWDGEEMVGAGFLMLTLLDNTDKGFAFVAVEPERRRHGIGTAVLDRLVAVARADGRTTLRSSSAVSFEDRETSEVLRWAASQGFRVVNTEIQRSLRLPVPSALLDELAHEAAAHHDGYEIATYTEGLPDELVQSYCDTSNQLILDAPAGDLEWEAEAATPTTVRQRQERDRQSGKTRVTSVALRDGEVVAYSDLAVSTGSDEGHQYGTLVRRGHRGHRLGLAVKVAALRRVQELRPDVTTVETTNAEVNAQMVGINDRLGFQPVAVVPELARTL